jgi:hypothetical protein
MKYIVKGPALEKKSREKYKMKKILHEKECRLTSPNYTKFEI